MAYIITVHMCEHVHCKCIPSLCKQPCCVAFLGNTQRGCQLHLLLASGTIGIAWRPSPFSDLGGGNGTPPVVALPSEVVNLSSLLVIKYTSSPEPMVETDCPHWCGFKRRMGESNLHVGLQLSNRTTLTWLRNVRNPEPTRRTFK